MNKQKTILVTGGTGFIGQNIVDHFSKSHTILAPSHADLDLTDKSAVNLFFGRNTIDYVIHAAFIGGKRNDSYDCNSTKNNIQMFLNIACNAYRVTKIIYFGSGAEFDKRDDIVHVSENDFGKSIPQDQYGFSKFLISILAREYANIYVVRLFGVFGPYEDRTQRFISYAILNALNNKPIKINQNVYFDYLYIKDLFAIVHYILNHSMKYRDYNVGSGKKVDLVSIAKLVKDIHGRDIKIIVKKKSFNKEYTVDISRFTKEAIGYKPDTLENSIKELYDWYNQENI